MGTWPAYLRPVNAFKPASIPIWTTRLIHSVENSTIPPVWLYLSNVLQFDGSHVVPVGLTLVFLFALTASFLFKVKTVKRGLFFLAFFFSPPVLLLLERGNSDSVLFMLVAFITVYLPKIRNLDPLVRLSISAAIIVIASVLKLYPLVLVPLLILEPVSLRKRIAVIICTSLLILGYLIYSFDVITLITHNTPQPLIMAYGKNVLLEKFFPDAWIPFVSNGLIVLVIIAVILLYGKGKGIISELYSSGTSISETVPPFIAGALIFAGTFVIGNNYMYRLSFLLLTIPYFLEQLAIQQATRVNSENILLAASLLLMVVYGTGFFDFLSGDSWRIIDWCMVGIVAVLLVLSLRPCFGKNNRKRSIKWIPLLTILQYWMLLLTFYGYRMGEFFISWYAVMGLACWGLLISFLVAATHYLIRHLTQVTA